MYEAVAWALVLVVITIFITTIVTAFKKLK